MKHRNSFLFLSVMLLSLVLLLLGCTLVDDQSDRSLPISYQSPEVPGAECTAYLFEAELEGETERTALAPAVVELSYDDSLSAYTGEYCREDETPLVAVVTLCDSQGDELSYGTAAEASEGILVTSVTSYAPGESGPAAGLVFHKASDLQTARSGYRFLESAPSPWWSSESEPLPCWGSCSLATGSVSQEVGGGRPNSLSMCSAAIEQELLAASAAGICRDLECQGVSDWFLPSIGELEALREQDPGTFTGLYWSSTEVSESTAYVLDGSTGQRLEVTKSYSNGPQVIPVHSF